MCDITLRILIVDDDELLRISLSQILVGSGYRVRSADGTIAALSDMGQDIPDILLSDLNMPGLSGFELLSTVRQRFPSIHVIAMSGAYHGESVPPGVVADAFYEKGRGVDSLMRMVAEVVRRDQSIRHS